MELFWAAVPLWKSNSRSIGPALVYESRPFRTCCRKSPNGGISLPCETCARQFSDKCTSRQVLFIKHKGVIALRAKELPARGDSGGPCTVVTSNSLTNGQRRSLDIQFASIAPIIQPFMVSLFS